MSNMMVIKDCRNSEKCLKLREVIDDFSLLEWQRAEMLCATCENCKDRLEK